MVSSRYVAEGRTKSDFMTEYQKEPAKRDVLMQALHTYIKRKKSGAKMDMGFISDLALPDRVRHLILICNSTLLSPNLQLRSIFFPHALLQTSLIDNFLAVKFTGGPHCYCHNDH